MIDMLGFDRPSVLRAGAGIKGPPSHAIHNPFAALPPIIFCRHGQKVVDRNIPTAAIRLTPEGEEEAEALSRFLFRYVRNKKRRWQNVLVVTSPMLRAHQTARPTIRRLMGSKILTLRVEEAPQLTETNTGIYQGVGAAATSKDAKFAHDLYEVFKKHEVPHFHRYFGGESQLDLYNRVHAWLVFKLIFSGPAVPDVIIIFGHSQTGKMLRKCVTGVTFEEHNTWESLDYAGAYLLGVGKYLGQIFAPTPLKN